MRISGLSGKFLAAWLLAGSIAAIAQQFQPAVNYAVGGQATDAAVGDFDGDGNPDLAVANISGKASILRGRGAVNSHCLYGTLPGKSPSRSQWATSTATAAWIWSSATT